MLTISGMHKGETKLTIPNQVVREQLFAYILDTYHENDLTFDSYEKRKLASGLAYDGKWKPYFGHSYIIELKYAKGKDSSERIEQLRRQAIEQAERYASSESVQKAISPTMLHKIIVVYRGMEMVVCEEL